MSGRIFFEEKKKHFDKTVTMSDEHDGANLWFL